MFRSRCSYDEYIIMTDLSKASKWTLIEQFINAVSIFPEPGDFGGNAHRGTR